MSEDDYVDAIIDHEFKKRNPNPMNKRLENADSYWETIEKETEKDFEIIEAVLKADRMNLSFFHPNGTSPKFVIDACNSHASNKKLIEAMAEALEQALTAFQLYGTGQKSDLSSSELCCIVGDALTLAKEAGYHA